MSGAYCDLLPIFLQPTQKDLKLFKEFLYDTSRTAIITHINPDPDALTSALALRRIKINAHPSASKEIKIFVESKLTQDLLEIPDITHVSQTKNLIKSLKQFSPQTIVLTDINHIQRLTTLEITELQKLLKKTTLYIFDHHISKTTIKKANIIQQHVLSTTELIYCLTKKLNLILDPIIKTLLAIGLISDTNLLKTLPNPEHPKRVLIDIIEDLIKDTSIPFHKILRIADVSLLPEMVPYLRILQNNLKFQEDIAFSYADFDNHFSPEFNHKKQLNPFVVRAVAFFITKILEALPYKVNFVIYRIKGRCFVSLRSNYSINLLPIAEHLGGGGHVFSAGATLTCPQAEDLEKYTGIVYNLLQQELAKQPQGSINTANA